MRENISHIPVFRRPLYLETDQTEGFQTYSHHVGPTSVLHLTVYFTGYSVVGRAENSEHDRVILALMVYAVYWFMCFNLQLVQTFG